MILPTKMMVREAKRYIIENGGGETGWIMTPRNMAKTLYDRLGGKIPVTDRGFREMAIRRILENNEYPHLSVPGVPMGGILRRISSTISTLILNEVKPNDLHDEGSRESEMREVYLKYISICRESMVLDREMVPVEVLKMLDRDVFPIEAMGIYLPGKLDRAYSKLLRAITERARYARITEHVCRKRPSFIPERVEKPPIRGCFRIPEEEDGVREMIYSDKRLKAITAEDPSSETREICRYIKEICSKGSDPGEITVVYPDRDPHEKEVRQVFFDYGIPHTSRKDQLVREMPCIVSLFEILETVLEGFPRGKLVRSLSSSHFNPKYDQEISVEDLEEATREAAVFGGGGDVEMEWLDPLKRASEECEDDKTEMFDRVRSGLEVVLGLLSDLKSKKRSAREHAVALGEMIEILGFDPGRTPEDRKAFDKFREALSDIRKNESILGPNRMDLRGFLSTLESTLEDVSITSGPERGVRIMGVGEFTGLGSKNVILASMTEKEIPQAEKPFNLLRDDNRERLGISRGHKRREMLENLCISLMGVEDPVISFYRTEGESPVSITPLLEEIPLEVIDTGDDPRSRIESLSYIGEQMVGSSLNTFKDPSGIFDMDQLLDDEFESISRVVKASNRRRSNALMGSLTDPELAERIRGMFHHDYVWSPSKLETYRDCPYRFFVENVLNLSPVEELEPEVPPDKKGVILHAVLERFYGSLMERGKNRVEPENLDEAWETARRCALEVLSSYSFRGPYWDAMRDMLLGFGGENGILRDFLELESSYRGPFFVRDCELSFGRDEGVRVGGDMAGEGLNLRGFVDRVDTMKADGRESFFIWDYKTGRLPPIKKSLQVPLYLAALKKLYPGSVPGGGGYYHIARKGGLERKIALGGGVWTGEGKDLSKEVKRVRSKMDRKVDEALEVVEGIRSASFPRKESCNNRFCEFHGMCRKGEWL